MKRKATAKEVNRKKLVITPIGEIRLLIPHGLGAAIDNRTVEEYFDDLYNKANYLNDFLEKNR